MQVQLSENDLTRFAISINKIYDVLQWAIPVSENFGKLEPPEKYRFDGLLAYANGTDWNPNSEGSGFYRWNLSTSSWVKVG